MRAELVLMGRRLDMSQRGRRRGLVVLVYAMLLLFLTWSWYLDQWRLTSSFIIFALILVCRLFLGGVYPGGLVKQFNNKKPREREGPPSLLALKVGLYRPVLEAHEGRYGNDERELHQRDHAHYLAYQALGAAVLVFWGVAYMGAVHSRLLAWMPVPLDRFYQGLAMMALVMLITLPQAILLWNEPDMEMEPEEEAE